MKKIAFAAFVLFCAVSVGFGESYGPKVVGGEFNRCVYECEKTYYNPQVCRSPYSKERYTEEDIKQYQDCLKNPQKTKIEYCRSHCMEKIGNF